MCITIILGRFCLIQVVCQGMVINETDGHIILIKSKKIETLAILILENKNSSKEYIPFVFPSIGLKLDRSRCTIGYYHIPDHINS